MEEIYRWAGTIVSYLVFVTVLTGLLPAARYEKYLRLFAGCVLILIVFHPLTGNLGLEESVEHLFRSISLKGEASELTSRMADGTGGQKAALESLEAKRLEILFSEYEQETAEEVRRMAEAAGFSVTGAEVTVERNPERPDFAGIKQVCLEVMAPEKAGEVPGGVEETAGEAIRISAVEAVEVEAELFSEWTAEASAEQTEEKRTRAGSWLGSESEKETKAETGKETGWLKQQIAAYYQVEEAYVEIRVED